MLVLLFVALWFILRGDLFCLVLFCSCVLVLLALRLPRLGKRELILMLFVRLFELPLFGFGFICLLFLLVLWEGLWLVIVALPGLFSYLFFFFFFFFFFVNYYDTLSDIMIFCLGWRWPYLRSFVYETL